MVRTDQIETFKVRTETLTLTMLLAAVVAVVVVVKNSKARIGTMRNNEATRVKPLLPWTSFPLVLFRI